ncbi:DUF3347 domain-containing protein [Ferruginibacter sp. HRS2-29]|uniref:DUF3347 domain-containing protein n=1 Tax=Ferruginibacter sp. HRS2-29 TaxID=2487334 RepID=UPI0020CBF386|nr:DUF3347 domain-containing protein [Ferruginibacter sp. HRS2-29]MCP9750626.1 DUF3347 domain-containing protein [Ferruginibacter sp. HRS2-29]
MKRLLFLLVAVLVAVSVYWFMLRKKESGPRAPKQAAIVLKKHSETFNKSVDKLVNDYLAIKNAFVEGDTAAAKKNTEAFISALDSIPLDELKKDTASIFETAQASVNDIRSNAQSLLKQTNITEMRMDFSMVTEMMYPGFFKSINYEGEKLYLQNCPMAFGDDKAANWISNSDEVVNPYLGKNDPKHKATMLHCGEVKDSIFAK